MTLVIVVVTLGCAGLGALLGTAVADDLGSILLITIGCGVLGSFAPGTIRWAIDEAHRGNRPAR
jgi:hypothetical protein